VAGLMSLVDIREHLFLQRPLVPKDVKESITNPIILNKLNLVTAEANGNETEYIIDEKDIFNVTDQYDGYQILTFVGVLGIKIHLNNSQHEDFLKRLHSFIK
jgi:hypothetical protein